MSTTESTPPVSDARDAGGPPEGAGLPMGNRLSQEAETRDPLRGEALLDAAASGEDLLVSEQVDLVDYFLTNGQLPGDDDVVSVEVSIGHHRPKKQVWEIRPITYDEWRDAQEKGFDEKTEDVNALVIASFMVGRALVKPKLGPVVARLQAEQGERAPADAAALLRKMFSKSSGALFELSAKVREISKLSDNQTSVREVEAGKR